MSSHGHKDHNDGDVCGLMGAILAYSVSKMPQHVLCFKKYVFFPSFKPWDIIRGAQMDREGMLRNTLEEHLSSVFLHKYHEA